MDENTRSNAIFAMQFTGFIYAWNCCELLARQLLTHLLGNSDLAMAVSVDMLNRSLCDALKAAARQQQQAELRAHLEHFVLGYETLIAYRNHYVHSLGLIDEGAATLLSYSSKGRLKYHSEKLDRLQVERMMNESAKLAGYASFLLRELGADVAGLKNLLALPPASLEKPRWPDPLKKLPRYIQEQ